MGAVYRATDTRLAREVAIKVLPDAYANDPDRLARFVREAQVLASLNHPNIAAIYGIEERAIVMELVEGPTLEDHIARGAVPLDEVVPIARQIAEALEAAHEKGIIHRDLKPANIKVTPDGKVKVLDFGLAKLADPTDANDDPASAPTVIRGNSPTLAGVIMGTAGYMSPEQARGKRVDKRADIWAFGVVLYEMLTAKPLFGGGETVTDMLAAVVYRDPDWNLLPAGTPATIRRLLDRCLRKDIKTRLRDIGEALILLDSTESSTEAVPAPTRTARHSWLPWALFAAAALTALFGWYRATRPTPLRPLVRLTAEMDLPITRTRLRPGRLAISPDGSRLAATLNAPDGTQRVYTRLLHQSQPSPLAGTEGAGHLFFSPDGKWLGFETTGKLKKVSVEGGAPIALCDATNVRGASWGDDGFIVFGVRASSLFRVTSEGGVPEPLTKVESNERNHRWPHVLPGSQFILFTSSETIEYDKANLEVLKVKTGERKVLIRGGHSGRYIATPSGAGRLIYLRQDTLFSIPFDLNAMAVKGTAVPVLEGVGNSVNAGAESAVSENGTLVYLPAMKSEDFATISWLDSTGTSQALDPKPGTYYTPQLSPDGKRLAYAVGTTEGTDIWVKDLERGASSRLSFLKGRNLLPMWTPDGRAIVFKSFESPKPGLYWVRSDGAAEVQQLTDGTLDEYPSSISPDGKRLAFAQRGNGLWDIYTAPMEGDPTHPKLGKREPFVNTQSMEINARFSPDGKWVVYTASELEVLQAFVRPFPGPGGRWQISTAGANFATWAANGRELYYRQTDGRIMVVPYTAKGDSFDVGKARPWSDHRLTLLTASWPTWDIAPGGKRMVALMPEVKEEQKPTTQLNVLLHFSDELQRRVTTP
ncbi:MAG: serine/threonine-protein kinase [Acidobacteria bacterium]|nr:serine/threonine-protein kinase [Acidobacteriota bacterium]